MILKKLQLAEFKNYSFAELEFSLKFNCFVGLNGMGKTNLLDAIYYLSFCKSFFNPVDYQNVRDGGNEFKLSGTYERQDREEFLSCWVRKSHRKQFKRNKKDYEKLADHIGLFPLVMVSPYDIELISGGSDLRRKFMDGIISQYEHSYLEDILNYNRALQQRNALLKHFAKERVFQKESLELWDEKLVELSDSIYKERQRFIEAFVPIFNNYYEKVSGKREKVSLAYRSQLHETSMKEGLDANVQKDLAVRFTSFGPHRDDLEFEIKGEAIKKFGSQGQQKTYLLALKLAQYDYLREQTSVKPILLLDDVFDKLDRERTANLMSLLNGKSFGQIFVTDTGEVRISELFKDITPEVRTFRVTEGQLTAI